MNNYFIIFRVQGKAYLSLTEDNSIITFHSINEAKASFETHYKDSHERGATWSASAAIHWLRLDPFIVALPATLSPLEAVQVMASSKKPNLQPQQLSSIAVRSLNVLEVSLEACLKLKVNQEIEMYNSNWWKQEGSKKS